MRVISGMKTLGEVAALGRSVGVFAGGGVVVEGAIEGVTLGVVLGSGGSVGGVGGPTVGVLVGSVGSIQHSDENA